MTLEGIGGSRLLQAMRTYGKDTTMPTTISRATVVTPSPISVRLDGDTEDTPSDGIIIAEHLTEHTRTIQLESGIEQTMTIKSPLTTGDPLIVAITNDGQLVYVLDKAVM